MTTDKRIKEITDALNGLIKVNNNLVTGFNKAVEVNNNLLAAINGQTNARAAVARVWLHEDEYSHILQIEFQNDTGITLTMWKDKERDQIHKDQPGDWGIWSGRNSYESYDPKWIQEWVEHATGRKENPLDEKNAWPTLLNIALEIEAWAGNEEMLRQFAKSLKASAENRRTGVRTKRTMETPETSAEIVQFPKPDGPDSPLVA